ncbi:Tetraspanin/Peripherin [Gaertneriomyces semiglobifer]|nr:Tetraspanin/Peripherin [Gaertneriomyces semiglobifer]
MLVKNLLLLINFLSLLAGLILIGGGAYLISSSSSAEEAIVNIGGTLATAAIVIGVIVTIVSFLGCFGAANEKGMLLKTYFALLILLVILEISVGAAAYSKRNSIGDAIEDTWTKAYTDYRATGNGRSIMTVQVTFNCCGFANTSAPTDGFYGGMVVPQPLLDGSGEVIPSSTCETLLDTTTPCQQAVIGSVNGSLGTIGAAGLVIGIIELIGLVFSAILFKRISQREEAAGSLLNEAWRINRNKIQYGYQNYQYV